MLNIHVHIQKHSLVNNIMQACLCVWVRESLIICNIIFISNYVSRKIIKKIDICMYFLVVYDMKSMDTRISVYMLLVLIRETKQTLKRPVG